MNSIQISELSTLAARINEEHRRAHKAMSEGLSYAVAAGNLLIEAKAKLEHGEWLPWLEANCEVKPRMAQNYMRLAAELPELEAKCATDAYLPMREALHLLAEPKEGPSSERGSVRPPVGDDPIETIGWYCAVKEGLQPRLSEASERCHELTPPDDVSEVELESLKALVHSMYELDDVLNQVRECDVRLDRAAWQIREDLLARKPANPEEKALLRDALHSLAGAFKSYWLRKVSCALAEIPVDVLDEYFERCHNKRGLMDELTHEGAIRYASKVMGVEGARVKAKRRPVTAEEVAA